MFYCFMTSNMYKNNKNKIIKQKNYHLTKEKNTKFKNIHFFFNFWPKKTIVYRTKINVIYFHFSLTFKNLCY